MRKLPAVAFAAVAASCGPAELGAPLRISSFKSIKVEGGLCGVGSADLSSGVYDKNSGAGFAVGVSISNTLSSNAGEGRANTFDATVDEVRVTLQDGKGATIAGTTADASIPVSIVIATNGLASAIIPLFGKTVGAGLTTGTFKAQVHVRGKLTDGTAVRSNGAVFAFTVCTDCVKPGCAQPSSCGVVDGGTAGQPDGFACQ